MTIEQARRRVLRLARHWDEVADDAEKRIFTRFGKRFADNLRRDAVALRLVLAFEAASSKEVKP